MSLEPAELILLQGKPKYEKVEGTALVWVSNTESDIFGVGKVGAMTLYYLVAGRWFSASDFTGPWTFATTALPEDFQKIPLEHPRSRVLASVPGTRQAAEAILLAQIPETARVNIKTLKAPEVSYQGDPTVRARARCDPGSERGQHRQGHLQDRRQVLHVLQRRLVLLERPDRSLGSRDQRSRRRFTRFPRAPRSHHVTYVTVEDDDDSDEWATFAVVAGYTGMMIAWGCVVWGSGWYYPPYVGYGGFYPAYYPRYGAYGYGARYNP